PASGRDGSATGSGALRTHRGYSCWTCLHRGGRGPWAHQGPTLISGPRGSRGHPPMRTRGRSVTIAFMSENATDPVPAGSARASDAEPAARPELPAGSGSGAGSGSMSAGSARRAGRHRPVLHGVPVPRPPSAVGFRWYPRLARDTHASVVGGVCAGLADHLGLKVTHVRLAMV